MIMDMPMRLDEAEDNIGREVIFHVKDGNHQPERGVIAHVNDPYIYVRYGDSSIPKATHPMLLEFSERSDEK